MMQHRVIMFACLCCESQSKESSYFIDFSIIYSAIFYEIYCAYSSVNIKKLINTSKT
jgi:hypothetical protein